MPPFELRYVTRDVLSYCRELCVKRKGIIFEAFGRDWSFAWKWIKKPSLGYKKLAADWGGARVILQFDPSVLDNLISVLMPSEGQTFVGDLPDALRTIVFESVFSEVAPLVEHATRKRFGIISANENFDYQDNYFGFFITVSDGAIDSSFELWMNETGLGFFSAAVRQFEIFSPLHDKWNKLPVPIQFTVGWTYLTLEALKSIEKNDVILIDECWLTGVELIHLKVGASAVIDGKIRGTKIEIAGNWERCVDEIDNEDIHEDALDRLSVRVSFDLGERVMTFSELRSLEPGYIFEMGRDLRHSVFIRVNGRIVGEGELVNIDGQTGVSVIRFLENI